MSGRGPERFTASLARRTSVSSTLLVAAAAAALAAAAVLSRPIVAAQGGPTRPALRAVVIDASGSALRLRRGWPRETAQFLREQATRALEHGEEVFVVRYGERVRHLFGPGDPQQLRDQLGGRGGLGVLDSATEGEGASELAAALDSVAEELLDPERAAARLVLRTDGTSTGRDPEPILARMSAGGVEVEFEDLRPADLASIELTRLSAPHRVEEGAPFAARVEVTWREPAGPGPTARPALSVALDGPHTAWRGEQLIDLGESAPVAGAGGQRLVQRVDLPPLERGGYTLAVRVRLIDSQGIVHGDPIPEDDLASVEIVVGDALRVAVVSADGTLPAALEPLQNQGLALRPYETAQVLGALAQADVLFTLGVGPGELPGPALLEFLRSGGGWLATVGWRFMGSWSAWDEADPRDPSSVLPFTPREEVGVERDVLLIVDGSGSMDGEPFERVRRALFELVPAALPGDHLELRFFTEMLGPVEFRSTGRTPAQRQRELAPLLESKLPSGGTDILYSLGQLAQSRRPADLDGLVLLLSDGRSSSDAPERGARVRAELNQSRLDLRVLVTGSHPDRGCLPSLLEPGEELLEAGDLSRLAELLQQELNRRRISKGPGLRAYPAVGRVEWVRDLLAAQQPGQRSGSLGALQTYARVQLTPGAELIWISSRAGEPLLAARPVGLGMVACLATEMAPGWAPSLVSDGALLVPLLQVLGRGIPRERRGARLVLEDGRLCLDGVPADWPYAIEYELFPLGLGNLAGTVPALVKGSFSLGPGGSALDPRARRCAQVPAALRRLQRGAPLEARLTADDRLLASLPLSAPGAPEWSGAARLLVRDLPPSPSSELARRPGPHPASPWLLGVGLLLGLAAALWGLRGWALERVDSVK